MKIHRSSSVYAVGVPALLFLLSFLTFAPSANALSIGGTVVASNYNVTTLANTPVTVNVLADDSCLLNGVPCVGGLEVQSVTQPGHGTAVINPSYTVTYTPVAGFAGSDSFTYTATSLVGLLSGTGTVYVTVDQRTTSTSVSPSSDSVAAGGSVTITATVTDTDSGTPSAPTGSVSWSSGGAGGTFVGGTCALSSKSSSESQCAVTYDTPASAGAVTITASYSGDSAHLKSSGSSSLTVTPPPPHPTSTTVSPNPASVTAGDTITFTAKVTDTSSSPTTPSGTITWSDGGTGSFSSTSCTLSSGACSDTYTAPSSSGSATITATYSGDSTHTTSSGASSLTVSSPALHSTTTSISPSTASATTGGATTFTVTVTDTSASPSSPSGTVSWSSGAAGGSFSSETCTLSASSSSASSCQITYTAPSSSGSVTITAAYSGDSSHSTSSGTSSLTVSAPTSYSIQKESSGMVFYDPLDNATMTQAQLQSKGTYFFGGSAAGESAPYGYNEDSQGLHLAIEAPSEGTYAGIYAEKVFSTGDVFQADVTAPAATIPEGYYDAGLYVQTGSGYIDYVFAGETTSSAGTYWIVSEETSNSTTGGTTYQSLWVNSAANQPLSENITVITNGSNSLAVYMDGSLVYSSSALNLQFTRPFEAYMEVESSYAGAELSSAFTDFGVATGTTLTVSSLPSSAASVELVGPSGSVLATASASGGTASLDVAGLTYPVSAEIVVLNSQGGTIVASSMLSLWGGDTYAVETG
jgi:hypothetical protein